MHIFTVAKEICVFLKVCWAGEHYFDVSIPTIFLSFLKTISILSKIFSMFSQIISCVELVSISLTYALSRRLSIPPTSHQFKPISSLSPHHRLFATNILPKPNQPYQIKQMKPIMQGGNQFIPILYHTHHHPKSDKTHLATNKPNIPSKPNQPYQTKPTKEMINWQLAMPS